MAVLEKLRLSAEQEAILVDGGIVRIPAGWEEFLDFKEETRYPAEFHHGEIIVTSMAKLIHEWLVGRIIRLLSEVFPTPDFLVLSSNIDLIKTDQSGYYNADVTIIQGEPTFFQEREDWLTNPFLVVEILSNSTRQKDFKEKIPEYQTMPSVKVVVVVDPKTDSITVHTRTERPKTWLTTLYDQPDELIQLDGRELLLADVFRGKPKSQSR
ncbi:MAG: Uma2 family endonuclease [Sphingobacteriaceae bacterium]|nr:Uma2 family endonuclease [Cytophagaceae bacterium]